MVATNGTQDTSMYRLPKMVTRPTTSLLVIKRRPRYPVAPPLKDQNTRFARLIAITRSRPCIERKTIPLYNFKQSQELQLTLNIVITRGSPRKFLKLDLCPFWRNFVFLDVCDESRNDLGGQVWGWVVEDLEFVSTVEGYADPFTRRGNVILLSKNKGIYSVRLLSAFRINSWLTFC